MGLSIEEAKAAVLARLAQRGVGGDEGVCILDDYTTTLPYGWAFSYQSKAFCETQDLWKKLVGAGPVVVVAATGAIFELGSAKPGSEAIRELEESEGLAKET